MDDGSDQNVDAPLTRRQRLVKPPEKEHKLRGLDCILLFMNRTIGSGIFLSPSFVLRGTGSVGAAMCLWAAGSIVSTCALMVWLELGLTLPRVPYGDGVRSMPRSGGEKNYLEETFPKAKRLVTCMYGMAFLVLGNLAGNSIACSNFIFAATGNPEPSRGAVIGVALAILTLSVIAHVWSRRGGIYISHFFAVIKILLLLAMICLGFASAGNHTPEGGQGPYLQNFQSDFDSTRGRNWSSFVDSFFYVVYAYSGFQQPFYVLAEFRTPRKTLPWASLTAMGITITLFLLLNAAYLCVVPQWSQFDDSPADMATLFFERLFGDHNAMAKQAMAGMIAVSIFGNLIVMTFTASRVKQEIAKEGILPWSLFFASDKTTPMARWWYSRSRTHNNGGSDANLENSPLPALGLHWLSSVVLVLVTATYLDPMTAFAILVSVYSYVIRVGMGFVVSGALLWHKLASSSQWNSYAQYRPWIGRRIPIPALIVFSVYGFVMYATFVPPSARSAFAYAHSHIQWFIVPAIGQSAWLWGIIWWLGLWAVQIVRQKRLVTRREPIPVPDPYDSTELIMHSEVVTVAWPRHLPKRPKNSEDFEMGSLDQDL